MSEEPPAKRVRKGTKSCLACRQRKIRCVWPTEALDTCQSCLARDRTCRLQVRMIPASESVGSTSRSRIESLEHNVDVLWKTVRRLEAQSGNVPTEVTSPPPVDNSARENSSDASPNDPPAHLFQLFNNDVLGPEDQEPITPARSITNRHDASKSSALWALMPRRNDLVSIAADASNWMTLFNSLFPNTGVIKNGDEMIAHHDNLQGSHANPVAIASLLLSVALTIKQAPKDLTVSTASGVKSGDSLVAEISDAVEKTVVADDDQLESLDGIACGLFFVRLQLGRSRMKKVWLVLRRVIAVAELIGLPKAAIAFNKHSWSPTNINGNLSEFAALQQRKAEMWESICAIDRISSMMWSLPLATTNFSLPTRAIYDPDGQFNRQSFLYRLVNIASNILDLDGIYAARKPIADLLTAAMAVDGKLRSLASLPSKDWWQTQWSQLSPDALLQYWHRYITIRTHIQLALVYDNNEDLAFGFVTCFNACQELLRRYVSLRRVAPDGFFANPVLDLQAFTATVFLLLAKQRPHPRSVNVNSSHLVAEVVKTLQKAANTAGKGPAHQAADAISSLRSLLELPQTSESRQKISLYLPLFGRIQVSRKSSSIADQTNESMLPPGDRSDLNAMSNMEIPNPFDPLDLSMELPEDYLYLTDKTFMVEDWLTWET